MAITPLQLPSPILGLPARNRCTGRRPRTAVFSCKHNQSTDVHKARLTSSISRRDTLAYMSSTFLATFLMGAPAEARTSRQDNKRKVREKLEKLREKALGPNEKDGATDKEKGPAANLLIPPTLVQATI